MAKGFFDLSEETVYTTFDKPQYEVAGIAGFFDNHKDSNGVPVFKPSKFNSDMEVKFNLMLTSGESGPPMSCTKVDLILLVKAFGGSIDNLDTYEGSSFLLQVEKRLDAIPVRVARIAHMRKGWVTRVEGMEIPEGFYEVKFIGARGLQGGDIEFKPLNNVDFPSSVANFDFEIVRGDSESETSFKGKRISILVNNPFDGTETTSDGTLPKMRKSDNPETPNFRVKPVRQMYAFLEVFAPEVHNHSWQSDATKSTYGINESENPLPVINAYAQKGNKSAVGFITYKKNYPQLDLESLRPVAQKKAFEGLESAISDPGARRIRLMAYIEALAKRVSPTTDTIFSGNGLQLTETGEVWCGKVIAPHWPNNVERKFALLTDGQIDSLMVTLDKAYPVEETRPF